MRRLYESPVFIVFVALLFRLLILFVVWHHGLSDAQGPYGFEVGRVAESIAQGKGFSSPSQLVETGPTAWLCPLYPYLVAAVFKIWGIFTPRSHIIIQAFNCALSALVILPIYSIARRCFNVGIAVASSWLWVFLPTAWHMPVQHIWETSLSALWFALLFLCTLAIRGHRNLAVWAGYGALWAIGLMINASFISVLPFLFLWLAWDARKRAIPWFQPLAVASAVLVLGLMPWTIRNYLLLGKPIFLRDNFGVMLWHGNNPLDAGADSFARSPFAYPPEAAEFKRLGEVRYMEMKQQAGFDFIRTHPRYFARLFIGRIWLNWFSVTDRPFTPWSSDPAYLKLYSFANAVMILFSFYGLAAFLRTRHPEAVPFLIILTFYPLVYYLTATLIRYRFPMDPLLVILFVYGFSRALAWTTGGKFARNLTPEVSAPSLRYRLPIR